MITNSASQAWFSPKNPAALSGILRAVLLVSSVLLPSWVMAHAGENHDDQGISLEVDSQDVVTLEEANVSENNLPGEIANIGGAFSLVNHLGETVTDKTYSGKHMLVFFGYSNCQVMCPISLKRISDALDILQADSDSVLNKLNTLVITVDPANDSPAILRENLSSYHPALTGLTGSVEQLTSVYRAYRQKPSVLDKKLNNNDVVTHTSYFYLMGPDGKLQTFFPPVLNAKSMADVIKKYIST